MNIGDSFPQSSTSHDTSTPQVRYISHPDILDDGEPILIPVEVPKTPAVLAIEAFVPEDVNPAEVIAEQVLTQDSKKLPQNLDDFIELVLQTTAKEIAEQAEPEVPEPDDDQEAIEAILALEAEKYRLKDIVLNLEQEIDDLQFKIRYYKAGVEKAQTDFINQQRVVQDLVDGQSYLAGELFEKDPFEMGTFAANVRILKSLKTEKEKLELDLSKNPIQIAIIGLEKKLAKAQKVYSAYCETHGLDQ